ncbi:hypothetical protein BGW36DRAFT_354243 [Talaromyces proteolyticus]|uniref:Uncharacterized protein n=1 Tax=Talaromyces proteolyticus TaxID=1131652 RepID=A0AAD4Q6M0_9EURO|nr:uncharacterized protein BGW36DRAFT_354243 [Talaromyces proteolyticus]KAH8705851.1 hypothetical protein BGW36DRAFT_354243 [Talaromyces proteolyticus]
MSATEVCGDFLTKIYQYTFEYLKKRLGAPVVEMTSFEFWFTVPAIWSYAAKAATWEAARHAGFGSRICDTVNFIPEPEAAAGATLSWASLNNSIRPVQKGEILIICDCGGGTVDVITYIITDTGPFRFDELIAGAGGKCGSTFVDRNFHKWMSSRFGVAFDDVAAEKKGVGSRFMREFELHKHDFGHADNFLDIQFEVPLVMCNVKNGRNYDTEDCQVKLSAKDMQTFFEPAVNKIKQILKQQVDAVRHKHSDNILKIILVGGFGDSPYLNNELALWAKSQGNIELLCPENPQAAVVKGAALRGLQGIKSSKKRARAHYGIEMMREFREGIDPESLAAYDPWNINEKVCLNRAIWKIRKGDSIDEKSRISQCIEVTNSDDEDPSFSADLYCCKSDNPPEYTSDQGVDIVGTLHLDLSRSDLQHFKTKRIDGVKYWKIEYDLHIYPAPSDGLLHVRAVMNGGKEIGVTTIRYESDMEVPTLG